MIKRFLLKKLIRNKFVEDCIEKKYSIMYSKLNNNDFEKALLEKLLEESNEVVDAKNNDELMSEIADVYEVLDELIIFKKIKKEDVLFRQKEKREQRGDFSGKNFVDYVEFKNECYYTRYFEENIKYEKHELTMHIVDFIVEKDGKIFIQKRSPNSKHFPNEWELPGGKLEIDNEGIYDCVKRELKEELSLDLVSIEEKIFDEILFEPQLGKHAYTVFYIKTSGDIKLEEGKATEFKWIDESEVSLLSLRQRDINPVHDAVVRFFASRK